MRTVFRNLMWLVATVSLAVTIGAGWAAGHVQDEDGFVSMAAELADDAEVQQAAANLAGEAFADQPAVPPALHEPAAAAMRRAVLDLTSSDGWDDAWRESMRDTHRRLFAEPTPTDVRVDVAPIVGLATDEVNRILPLPLPRPETLPVVVNEEDPGAAVDLFSRADRIALTTALVTVVAAVLALVAATRRSAMLTALGLGALLAAGFWWFAGRFVLPQLIERDNDASAYGQALGEVAWQRIVASLDPTLLWVAIVGVVMAGVGLVSRAARS